MASGVAAAAGETQLTRIPYRPSSAAAFIVSPSRAHFAHVYACDAAPATAEARLDVPMMQPRRAGTITRAACFVPRNDPTRLTASTRSKSSLVLSRMLWHAAPPMPALLNMMSSFPNLATAWSTAPAMSSSLVTSQRT